MRKSALLVVLAAAVMICLIPAAAGADVVYDTFAPTNPAQVTEGGKPAGKAEGVEFVEMRDGCAVFEVGSGEYGFVVK